MHQCLDAQMLCVERDSLVASAHDQRWLAVDIGYLRMRAWGGASRRRGQELRHGSASVQRASCRTARFAAAIDPQFDVVGEQLHQAIEFALLHCAQKLRE